MPNYCPLCEKKGIQAKIKLHQINFEETVLLCGTLECLWPFGYEDFKYFPREATGKTWSYYWNDYNILTENNFAPAPLELSLDSPPRTPFTDSLKNLTELLSPDSTISNNAINNSISPIKISTPNFLDHDDYCLKNATSKNIGNKSDNCNIHEQNPDIEKIIHKDDQKQFNCENKFDVNDESKNLSNTTSNLDVTCDSNIFCEIICDMDKEFNYSTDTLNSDDYKSVKKNLIEEKEEHYHSINNDDNNDQNRNNIESLNSALNSKNKFTEESTSSNLKMTKIEVNGLPVTFSYEVPNLSLSSTTVLNTTQSNNVSSSMDISSSITSINTTSKSFGKEKISIHKSKKHKKFNFSTLKKKPYNVNSVLTKSKDIDNSKDIVTNQIPKPKSPLKTIKPSVDVDKNMEVEFAKNDVDKNVYENTETNLNIDNILDEFLTGDKQVVNENNELINYGEDWIQSLFN